MTQEYYTSNILKQVLVIEDTNNLDLTIPAKGSDRNVDIEVRLYPNVSVKVNGNIVNSDFIITTDAVHIEGT